MAIQANAADIHLRSSQAMGLSARSSFSITAWVNATWNNGATASMVGLYGPATDTPLGAPVTAVQFGTQVGNYDLAVWTWGGSNLAVTATGYMTGFNGVWVFLAYTYDGTTHSLYRNGVLAASSTVVQQAGFLNQVYIDGYPGTTTNETSSFQVDQYALYRRTLSSDEILTIYNSSGARHGDMQNLICRYEFDELSQGNNVASVVDLTGNGHTLTLTGAGTAMTYTYNNTFANSNIRPVQ